MQQIEDLYEGLDPDKERGYVADWGLAGEGAGAHRDILAVARDRRDWEQNLAIYQYRPYKFAEVDFHRLLDRSRMPDDDWQKDD